MLIGLVSWLTVSDKTGLKPDILHMYILKSVGHCTLFLSIINLSCALLEESKFPVAVARFRNWVSFHCTGGVWPAATDTTVSNIVLEFLCNSMEYTALSCEGLAMEHTMTKSFSL